jgi:hypothetical protein
MPETLFLSFKGKSPRSRALLFLHIETAQNHYAGAINHRGVDKVKDYRQISLCGFRGRGLGDMRRDNFAKLHQFVNGIPG